MRAYHISTEITCARTTQDLRETFAKWGIGRADWSVDYNVPRARVNGVRYDRDERGVTVRWMRDGREIMLALDSQATPARNLRALYLAIEGIRMNERRGVDLGVMRSALLQLAGPAGPRPWHEILRVARDAPMEVVEASYRALAKLAHPDVGGSDEAMRELNDAVERARKERGQ